MRRLIEKAWKKYRTDGIISLMSSIPTYARNRYPAAIAKLTVSALIATGRTIRADELAGDSFDYTPEQHVRASIDGGSPPEELLEHLGEWSSRPQSVRVLNDVRVIGPYGLVVSDSRKVVTDCVCDSEYMLRVCIRKMIKNVGTLGTARLLAGGMLNLGVECHTTEKSYVLSMLNTHANNYFHWTVEHLPRLRSVEAIPGATRDDVELLVRSSAPEFVAESLGLLGVTAVDSWDGGVKQVDALLVPDHRLRSRFNEFRVAPADLRWLRSNLIDAIDDARNPSSSEQIYISRSDADSRRVTNETVLISAIEPMGFEPYVLSDMSVKDQIRLFRRADTVVAPHGAGLANIIFAESATVVELYADDLVQGRYFMLLANEMSHDYYVTDCRTLENDLTVPVERLSKLLGEQSHRS